MKRREFIAKLAAVPLAALVPVTPATLAFHRDAFALSMASLPMRYDVLYGCGSLMPSLACRILWDDRVSALDLKRQAGKARYERRYRRIGLSQ